MLKKYFGTDGIWGRVNKTKINGEMFLNLALRQEHILKSKKFKQTAVIAKDTRLSGYTLEPALVSGLTQLECMFIHWALYPQMDLPC